MGAGQRLDAATGDVDHGDRRHARRGAFPHRGGASAALGRTDAFEGDPGLGAKIAALGIKVSRHRSYHGVALNVAMDLAPFGRVNPCGYAGLVTTDLRSLGISASWVEVATQLASQLQRRLAA